jgi:hypothetical protein
MAGIQVEEALFYLDQVKADFSDCPRMYKEFPSGYLEYIQGTRYDRYSRCHYECLEVVPRK